MAHRNPMTTIDSLPVAAIFPELRSALQSESSAILVAPPGAGKTTAVPLALWDASWLAGQRILLLAPRRLAARTAARRMAALMNQKVGQAVGYRVRMESRVGPTTRIEVITEGVLTRMLQDDPSLAGVGLVIFDEFHERSLDADLGLALCRDIQGVLNDTLRLLVMSATLDPAPVTDLLDDAPLIRCEGRMFPVETRYIEPAKDQTVERIVTRVIRQSANRGEGNILAFLPGAAEISRTVRLLEAGDLPQGWSVAPLFGSLPRDRQDAAIAPPPAGQRKIVLATSIAETSLTIEGITVVVDSGLQRAPRFDPGSGMTRLVTLPVSRASADQRRGRAGRLGPGICYRLWRETATPSLAATNRPEILDAELSALALELALWGVDHPDRLDWLDPPPPGALAHARQLLADLGALDEGGSITAHGRRMARLPLHPRLAHMILAAREANLGPEACDTAAILCDRDPLHFTAQWRDADLKLRLEALQAHRASQPFSIQGCRVNRHAIKQALILSATLQRRLGIQGRVRRPIQPGRLLAWAYPDRIGRQRPGRPNRFLLTSGRGAFFDPPEPLGANEYIVAAQLDGNRRDARIFMAAAIDRQHLLEQFAHRIQWQEDISWNRRRKAVEANRRLMLGALSLATEPLRTPPADAVMPALLGGIREVGIDDLPWTRRLRTWQARVMLLSRIQADDAPWPDIGDDTLAATLEQWLSPYLNGLQRLADLSVTDFSQALRNRLTWRQQRQVDKWAPTHITVPSGSRLPIDYNDAEPVLAVRIQELFGLTTTPAIADGRIPLTLHLLSPANRPAQITRDLAGFWKDSYFQVRKELKGRYPKHAWPVDPLAARPTARAKPRKRN
jgi:ATP-dependent helicase HrpB